MRKLLLLIVCAVGSSLALAGQEPRPFVPVTDAMLRQPAPGDWPMWRRTWDATGYSPLDQITPRNVGQLRLVWARGMGPGRQEATPLVYDGVMYLPNPDDLIQAFDAATGDMLWEYKRQRAADARRANEGNRNIAIYGTNILDLTSDNFVIALDARTGKLVWETPVLERTRRATASSGPIVAGGKVIGGRNCLPDAGPDACVITAHDAVTGKELWRTRTIAMPGEPGGETWGNVPAEQRVHVGTWMVPSYDAVTNLVIIGTSVTSPAPKFILGGNDLEHLYHNSTLALDADTGKIVWHYQHVVDHWDLDHPYERLIVETAVRPDPRDVPWINPRLRPGERRRVITGIPGKTGVVYTLDAKTGEFLWARPTHYQNVISRIAGDTGKATVNPETLFTGVGQERVVCPGANGGKNFQAGAYSPRTNTMYYPLQNICMTATSLIDKPDPKSAYGLNMQAMIAPGTTNVGAVWAISAETGRTTWKHDQRAAALSLVATGGGLVFGGDASGRFRAFDETTGRILWETNLGSAVSGYPVSFAVNGKQYVAVSTGPSLVANASNRLTPELKPSDANTIFVFALP